jgi:hypothetical protein
MDFAAAVITSVQEICDVVEPRIQAVGGSFAAATCGLDSTGNKIIIRSGTYGATTSHVGYADTPSSGTDVSGNTYLELDSAQGTLVSGRDAGDVYQFDGETGVANIGAIVRMYDISVDDGERYLAGRIKADVLCDGGTCGAFESEFKIGQASASGGSVLERITGSNLGPIKINRGTAASEAYGVLLEDSDAAEAGWVRPPPNMGGDKTSWQLPDRGGNTGLDGDYTDGVITFLAQAWSNILVTPGARTLFESDMGDTLVRSVTSASTVTLPVIDATNLGMRFCAYDDVGAQIDIDPGDTTDHIDLRGLSLGAGDRLVSSGNKGDYVCLKAIETDTWIVTEENEGGGQGGIFYNAILGASPVARGFAAANTFYVVDPDFSEVSNRSGLFSITTGNDEICYDGPGDIEVKIYIAHSFERTAGSSAIDVTLQLGQDATGAIADTDEFGSPFIRTISVNSQHGAGSVDAFATLGSTNGECLSLMAASSTTSGTPTITMSGISISITELDPTPAWTDGGP